MQAIEDIQPVGFGSYQLLERLAMGGMAEVFLARPEGQERFVAIKRILPNIAADDDFIAMFIDEAKIAGQLTHPNITQILDIGKISNSYFISMEYVSGHDLRAVWDKSREQAELAGGDEVKGLPFGIACHIVKKLAEGLDHAHRKRDQKGRPLGIIHRDVSPQNVLISYEGDLKIIDFGIAKAANRIVKTQTGILKGKFAYMAPEQARGEPIDHRSDIFAIGVVLYELLTGERCFRGDTDFALLEKVRHVDITPPRELRPDLPRELDRIIMKALRKDAGERYAWASALAGDLDRFLSDQGVTTSREELGAFVRRSFRDDYAEEQRRLSILRRRGGTDRTERIDVDGVSSSSIIRGGAGAKNGGRRQESDEADPYDATAVGIAELETAIADPAPESAVLPIADSPVDTKKHKRRGSQLGSKQESPPTGDDLGTGSTRRRRRDGLAALHDEARRVADADPARDFAAEKTSEPASSTKAPSTAVGPTVQSFPDPPGTSSLSRRRRRDAVRPAPVPADSMHSADGQSSGLSLDQPARDLEPPPLSPSLAPERYEESGRRDGGTAEIQQVQQARVSNVVIVAACLLGALLGVGLGVGITMTSRAPPPDTLIVVTPRQSEVRSGDTVVCAQTPCAVHLGAGKHELLIQAPGAEAVTRTVEVGEGAAVLDVTLDRQAKGIRVESEPTGALVMLNGELLPEPTPLTLPPIMVGKSVRLTLTHDGFEQLTAMRIVEGDEVWRFDLPTPTTKWNITVTPDDALIDAGRYEGAGSLTLVAGRRPQEVKVSRPGCEEQTLTVAGNGKAAGDLKVDLRCRTFDTKLILETRGRPRQVRIDGVVLPRNVDLSGYVLPPGTWNVQIISRRGRRDNQTVETRRNEATTLVSRVR